MRTKLSLQNSQPRRYKIQRQVLLPSRQHPLSPVLKRIPHDRAPSISMKKAANSEIRVHSSTTAHLRPMRRSNLATFITERTQWKSHWSNSNSCSERSHDLATSLESTSLKTSFDYPSGS